MNLRAMPSPTLEDAPVRLIRELSVVLPVYNEQDVLDTALSEAVTALDELCDRWELIVVDDGSTDATPAILDAWSRREIRLRVLTQPVNRGYSQALVRGFADCRYESVFYTDGDAQFDLRELADLYPRLKETPMVAGYRLDRQDPPVRLLTSAVFNRLQGWLLGIRGVRDVNCAFKLFRRCYFERVKLSSEGFLIDAEMYARAQREGLSWVQVGVRHRPRQAGKSSVRLRTVTDTLTELWQLRRSLKASRRRDFGKDSGLFGRQQPLGGR